MALNDDVEQSITSSEISLHPHNFPFVQWPAGIRQSGAWLGVQGVFNWSKYVVKFSAYSSIL